MTQQRNDAELGPDVLRALRSTALAGDGVPTRVLLAPWGAVESTNGSFVVDDDAARMVMEAFAAHGTDLPIDFEHQTLGGSYASPTGQAPAAGWIKKITAEPGVGLLADIEWTEQAERMLADKQYRYLSPVAIIRKTDRRLVGLHSAALTNKPAIRGMEAIVNRAEPHDDDAEVTPMAQLRSALQLPDDAEVEVVLAAAGRRICELQDAARQTFVEQRIAEAMRAGKLVEAQRGWAEALVAREAGLFEEWMATAPVVVAPGRLRPPQHEGGVGEAARGTVARARAEFRTNPLLSRLTNEDAYVACALRGGGAHEN